MGVLSSMHISGHVILVLFAGGGGKGEKAVILHVDCLGPLNTISGRSRDLIVGGGGTGIKKMVWFKWGGNQAFALVPSITEDHKHNTDQGLIYAWFTQCVDDTFPPPPQ